MASEFLTVTEVAERLRVSKFTVYTWIRKRISPPVKKFNGSIRFPRKEFEEWMNKAGDAS